MIWRTLFCLLAFTLPASTWAMTPIQNGIDKILAKMDPNAHVGIVVKSANTGKLLYLSNPNNIFVPASVQKLFTAAAALSYLGKNYRFNTKVLATTRKIKKGVLKSDVYFKFSGDPTLKRKDLGRLVDQLAKKGVRKIKGHVYIDDTAFDHVGLGPGWMWDEQNFCYAAPINAIILDKNCFSFRLKPGRKLGKPARVIKAKKYRSIPLISSVMTSKAGQNTCPFDIYATRKNIYYITGCIKPDAKPMSLKISLYYTRPYASGIIKNLLKQHKIRFLGKVKFRRASGKLTALATHKSKPLRILVKDVLKESDNVIANALYKRLGASYFKQPGSWKNGSKAIQRILKKSAGLNFKKMRIVDGAGLSRYNLNTPMQLANLLYYAYHNRAIKNSFISALPISGRDGSLDNRLKGPKTRGKVLAKTGTMSSVSALAGYVKTKTHGTLILAFIANGYIGRSTQYKLLEDRISAFLATS